MNKLQAATNSSHSLMSTLQNAVDYAIKIQCQEGYWVGALDSNSTMEAEYLMLLYFLGVHDEITWRKVANHILAQQREDGTWGQYYQGPGDLSTTVECYFALKLAGISSERSEMIKAKEFILAKGGIPNVRVFTKIWLALFAQWPWERIPVLAPEILLVPNWFPINIYELASWARATIVPLTLVLAHKPTCAIPEAAELDELFPATFDKKDFTIPIPKPIASWRGFFWIFDKVLRTYNKLPWKPFRKYAENKVVSWILDHQESDGSWGAIQPPWVYSLIALKLKGYDLNHPVMKKGLEGFKGFSIEKHDTLQVQACISPVWDTGLMMIALQDAGIAPNHPILQKACRWMISKQILKGGDWQVKNPHTKPGGWAFEFENDQYPDIDDTAEVLISILRTQLPPEEKTMQQESLKLGTDWMVSMQCKNGGWAAFDKDNENFFITKIPFFDFGETLDPPSVDVTAHVIEALGRIGYKSDAKFIKTAINYMYDEQEPDGSWFGRWGVNHIYGTGAVLPALEAIGEDMTQPQIRKAVNWVIAHQNSDGGWGETCASYVDNKQRGRGPSTASQTAWALMALMAAGEWEHTAVVRGIEFLCNTMIETGTWDEPYYTGCGFPGYGEGKRQDKMPKQGETGYQGVELPAGFLINYNLYRHYWPLMALGRYYRYLNGEIKKSTD